MVEKNYKFYVEEINLENIVLKNTKLWIKILVLLMYILAFLVPVLFFAENSIIAFIYIIFWLLFTFILGIWLEIRLKQENRRSYSVSEIHFD